jgi:hypothetical protein
MFSPAIIIVKNHQKELQNEAAANRLAKKAKRLSPSIGSRIAASLASLRSILTSPAEGPLVPKLSDYPYRS